MKRSVTMLKKRDRTAIIITLIIVTAAFYYSEVGEDSMKKAFYILEIALLFIFTGTAVLFEMPLGDSLKFIFLIGGSLMFMLWIFYRAYTRKIRYRSFYDDVTAPMDIIAKLQSRKKT